MLTTMMFSSRARMSPTVPPSVCTPSPSVKPPPWIHTSTGAPLLGHLERGVHVDVEAVLFGLRAQDGDDLRARARAGVGVQRVGPRRGRSGRRKAQVARGRRGVWDAQVADRPVADAAAHGPVLGHRPRWAWRPRTDAPSEQPATEPSTPSRGSSVHAGCGRRGRRKRDDGGGHGRDATSTVAPAFTDVFAIGSLGRGP
jgi:hypothetical protein